MAEEGFCRHISFIRGKDLFRQWKATLNTLKTPRFSTETFRSSLDYSRVLESSTDNVWLKKDSVGIYCL